MLNSTVLSLLYLQLIVKNLNAINFQIKYREISFFCSSWI